QCLAREICCVKRSTCMHRHRVLRWPVQHLYGRIKRYKSVEITHIALAVARGDRKERTSERKRRSSHAQERFNTATIFESLLPWLIVQHCLVCAFCARDR